jgi:pimeloyl-ACP methyl ester carboxylesterase
MGATRRTGIIDHDGESIYYELMRCDRAVGDLAGRGEGSARDEPHVEPREPRDASDASLGATERDHVIGELVVLSHGLGGNHASWYQQVGPLVAAGYDVLTWDQRGFGGSSRRTGVIGPVPAVGDLLALLDELIVERCHLVGQSMGGWTAMGFAVAHQERLASLVITDTLAGVMTDGLRDALSARPGAGRAAVADGAVSDHPALGERFCREHPERALLYQELAGFGDKPDDADVLALLASTWYDLDAINLLTLPVLAVVGANDQLCPPAAMEAVVAAVPGARLAVVDGAGHSPYFEAPDEWNRTVIGFLGTVGGHN